MNIFWIYFSRLLLAIIFIVLLMLAISCNPVRQKKRAIKRLNEIVQAYPDAIKQKDSSWSDTIRKRIEVHEEFENRPKDSVVYTKEDSALSTQPICADVIKPIGKNKIKPNKRITAEDLLDPIHVDTLGIIFKVDYKGNKQVVYIEGNTKQVHDHVVHTEIIKCPELSFWQHAKKIWMIWVIPWLVIILLLVIKLK